MLGAEEDVAFDRANRGLLGALAVVGGPGGLMDAIEDAELWRLGWASLPACPRGAAITAGQQRHVVAWRACLLDGHVSWPGSVGDRHEGPQVANRIHRTASIGQRRTATGDPQITMLKLNWSDLFADRWLRARDLNPQLMGHRHERQRGFKVAFGPPIGTSVLRSGLRRAFQSIVQWPSRPPRKSLSVPCGMTGHGSLWDPVAPRGRRQKCGRRSPP
jgi:hypothetical protein